jgi:hypothetical protein
MYQGRLEGLDPGWGELIKYGINTARDIISPKSRPSYQTTSPAGTAAVGIAGSPAVWVLAGLAAVLLLTRRK